MTEHTIAQLIGMLIPATSLWRIWDDYKSSQKKENPVEEFKTLNYSQRFSGRYHAIIAQTLLIFHIAFTIASFTHPNKNILTFPEKTFPFIFVWALYYPLCIALYISCLRKLEKKHPSQSGETVNRNIMRILRDDFLLFLSMFACFYLFAIAK